jgi:hypothetical protein
MEPTPFELTPEQKALLASMINEAGQPVATLAAAVVAAVTALALQQNRASSAHGQEGTPADSVGSHTTYTPLWEVVRERMKTVPEETWEAWPHNPEGIDLHTADASDPTIRQRLIQELGGRMHRLSEQAYCAGWMSGLEARLPVLCEQAVKTGKPQPLGTIVLCPGLAARLLAMRAKLGHWVVPAVEGGYSHC